MRYSLGCHLSYRVFSETLFIFNLEVARLTRHRELRETLTFWPDLPVRTYTVPDAQNRYAAVLVPPGDFAVDYEAEVDLDVFRADSTTIDEMPVAELPLDILPYLLPSRFVSSDRLGAFAQREFGWLPKGHRRVTAICNWIYANFDYRRGSSDGETTADESLLARAGVCRDFAHVGIAFCRALGIPARFVSCYAFGLKPPDFHAVFEAYLAGRWWLFDATRQANLAGLVRIGVGRDAAEIAFCTPFGDMQPMDMAVHIGYADGSLEYGRRTVEAISTDEPAGAGARS
ncbi:transglutaminase family protein [Beijerinckia sp. L45]|uniref:transglutaminase-like domain-containing protein n=1 Tax=Beijerinckia sp. L45 TaxID=1641855 RepID=UPI00131E031F|nr:transglutaminase family protein [Beijerinckia sp. L45]